GGGRRAAGGEGPAAGGVAGAAGGEIQDELRCARGRCGGGGECRQRGERGEQEARRAEQGKARQPVLHGVLRGCLATARRARTAVQQRCCFYRWRGNRGSNAPLIRDTWQTIRSTDILLERLARSARPRAGGAARPVLRVVPAHSDIGATSFRMLRVGRVGMLAHLTTSLVVPQRQENCPPITWSTR